VGFQKKSEGVKNHSQVPRGGGCKGKRGSPRNKKHVQGEGVDQLGGGWWTCVQPMVG